MPIPALPDLPSRFLYMAYLSGLEAVIPFHGVASATPKPVDKQAEKQEAKKVEPTPSSKPAAAPAEKVEKKPAPEASKATSAAVPQPTAASGPRADDDVSNVDIRVGRIVEAIKHPDADSLYVETVDLGEGSTRTIVSGLANFIPLEQLQGRLALFVCNLKPAKMRGVESQGMIVAASNAEHTIVELLEVPEGSAPGDRVTWPGYPGEPVPQLNAKKKQFESIQPNFTTIADGTAVFKGVPFTLPRGVARAPTLGAGATVR
eukprot:TRINITY_DN732_c0_g1_i6.p1 TRINITY_DN732_c0_g1~~TRINITY_DN732_c0_g1_i6.p1  ORF type:complete len:261 (+),score=67.79 TRINITY_DN732_c0_g1_i6:826-1608(+)